MKKHSFKVKETDFAKFESGIVHKVCATFSLAREIEWSSRLFVLEMLDEEEEGFGTMLNIKHLAPAFLHETVDVFATYSGIKAGEIICDVQVLVGERKIAQGKTGQKIVSKERIKRLFRNN